MSASVSSSTPPGEPLLAAIASASTRARRSVALRTRRRTRPTEERRSKITTRMRRSPTTEMCMLSRSPSWKRMENSFSPMRLASPPVAAMFPAASEAREVVSNPAASPEEARSVPFLSTRKTTFAKASTISLRRIPRNSSYSRSRTMKCPWFIGEKIPHAPRYSYGGGTPGSELRTGVGRPPFPPLLPHEPGEEEGEVGPETDDEERRGLGGDHREDGPGDLLHGDAGDPAGDEKVDPDRGRDLADRHVRRHHDPEVDEVDPEGIDHGKKDRAAADQRGPPGRGLLHGRHLDLLHPAADPSSRGQCPRDRPRPLRDRDDGEHGGRPDHAPGRGQPFRRLRDRPHLHEGDLPGRPPDGRRPGRGAPRHQFLARPLPLPHPVHAVGAEGMGGAPLPYEVRSLGYPHRRNNGGHVVSSRL